MEWDGQQDYAAYLEQRYGLGAAQEEVRRDAGVGFARASRGGTPAPCRRCNLLVQNGGDFEDDGSTYATTSVSPRRRRVPAHLQPPALAVRLLLLPSAGPFAAWTAHEPAHCSPACPTRWRRTSGGRHQSASPPARSRQRSG